MSESSSLLLMLLMMVAVFWLFIVRPTKKRNQEFATLQSELEPGAQIVTMSGIFAEIVSLDDTEARLRIADGVEIRVLRQAIARVVQPESAD